MDFNSFEYVFLFLPVVLVLYHATRRRPYVSNLVILLASYFFYAYGHAWVILLLIFSSVADYYLGNAIHHAVVPQQRKRFLVLSCVFNLGLLGFFKYADWLTGIAHGWWAFIPAMAIPLPHGISFYTFQSLSYTIDIYRKRIQPESSLVHYLTFVSFFPHLVAGPILKAREILPQLGHVRPRVSPRIAEKAVFMICWGLFKKIVCADNLSEMVSLMHPHIDKGAIGMLLALAWTFQVYCDFSAYTDIARGTARLFGVRIPRNFLTPFFARNPADLWQRWHISLSTWLRDYLYIPLGGSRGSGARTAFNVFVTMGLAGLWHGAGIFFIGWGIFHAMVIVLYRLLPIDEIVIRTFGQKLGGALATMIMFSFFVMGIMVFLSRDVADFGHMLRSSFWVLGHGFGPLGNKVVWGLVLFAAPIMVTDWFGHRRSREFVDLYPAWPLVQKVVYYLAILYAVLFFAVRSSNDFIYFQF